MKSLNAWDVWYVNTGSLTPAVIVNLDPLEVLPVSNSGKIEVSHSIYPNPEQFCIRIGKLYDAEIKKIMWKYINCRYEVNMH